MMVAGTSRIVFSAPWGASSLFGGEKMLTAGGNGERARLSIDKLFRRRRCLGRGPWSSPDVCDTLVSSGTAGGADSAAGASAWDSGF